MSMVVNLYVLSTHQPSHSNDEVILNPGFYQELKPNELIHIFDPENPNNYLITRVPPVPSTTSTLEISIQKPIADSVNLSQYTKVTLARISDEDASLDFIELSFKRQYLQRSNMFRFKQALIGRTIHINQNISVLGMQAQFQDLRKAVEDRKCGLVTESTKLVFRSKSCRIIWLVQISAEMWDIDPGGEMYFDKFLKGFVGPIFDSWKALGVSHMLTVIFFARTIYLDRITRLSHSEFMSKKSVNYSNGYHQQDFLKIVVENIADIDKVSLIKQLKQEFWDFPRILGWKIPMPTGKGNESTESMTTGAASTLGDEFDNATPRNNIETAVPSDSVHGNFLGAINTSLNLLEKHHMDRDLLRTGNSIVVISAGCGVFKVRPHFSQITKQRMLDSAFGIDFISLSRMPIHAVPLFIVSAPIAGGREFYEVPHWMKVSYLDCKKKEFLSLVEETKVIRSKHSKKCEQDYDELWSSELHPHPTSFILTSILTYSSSLSTLKSSYLAHLPFALRELLYHLQRQEQQLLVSQSGPPRIDPLPLESPQTPLKPGQLPLLPQISHESSGEVLPSMSSFLLSVKGATATCSTSRDIHQRRLPPWGKIHLTNAEIAENKKFSNLGHSTESVLLLPDIVKLRILSLKGYLNPDGGDNPNTTTSAANTSAATKAGNTNNNNNSTAPTETNTNTTARGIAAAVTSTATPNKSSSSEKVPAPAATTTQTTNTNEVASSPALTSTTKLIYMNLLNSVPTLRRDNALAASYNSTHNEGGDELDESHHSSHLGRSFGSNISNSYEEHRFFTAFPPGTSMTELSNLPMTTQAMSSHHSSRKGHLGGSSTLPIHIDQGGHSEQIMRLDSRTGNTPSLKLVDAAGSGASNAKLSALYYQNVIMTRAKIDDALHQTRSKPLTSDELKDMMKQHDSLMYHWYARVKPDPNAKKDDKSPHGSDRDLSNASSFDLLSRSDGISIGANDLVPPPPPVTAAFSSPTKSILKNHHSSSNLASSGNNSSLYPPTSSSAPTHDEAMKEAKSVRVEEREKTDNTAGRQTAQNPPPMMKGTVGANYGNRGGSNWRMNPSMMPANRNANDTIKTAYKNAMLAKNQTSRKIPSSNSNPDLPQVAVANSSQSQSKKKVNTVPVIETKAAEVVGSQSPVPSSAPASNAVIVTPERKEGSSSTQPQIITPSAMRAKNNTTPSPSHSAMKKTKLSSKNFIARNMVRNLPKTMAPRSLPGGGNGSRGEGSESDKPGFIYLHGKVIPLPGVDSAKQKEKELLEYIKQYASQYGINPFLLKEGEKYVNSITHNRRRWSHVFPSRSEKFIDYSLNWKSLTQPAILPLNTDYLPSVKDLEKNYTMHNYIVTIDKYDCPFPSLQAALQELVCQRLSREFQLVEGFDKSVYFRINRYDNVINNQKRETFYQNFFILTMGHRIHFLLGDVDENRIYVTSFFSKKAHNPEDIEGQESTEKEINSFSAHHYFYEMWIAHRQRFQCVSQKFYQFPKKEYLWNRLDNLITGGLDYEVSLVDDLKPRYVHFLLLPNQMMMTTEEEVNEFYAKIDQFLEFMNKYVPKDRNNSISGAGVEKAVMTLQKDKTILSTISSIDAANLPSGPMKDYWINRPILYYKKATQSPMNVVKCQLRSPEAGNPNWVYLKYDAQIYTYKAFHIEIQWFVCDSWLIDDFVTLIYRRCNRFGLRVVQTPAYFNSSNLNIHPYRPAPYISLLPSSSSMTNTISSVSNTGVAGGGGSVGVGAASGISATLGGVGGAMGSVNTATTNTGSGLTAPNTPVPSLLPGSSNRLLMDSLSAGGGGGSGTNTGTHSQLDSPVVKPLTTATTSMSASSSNLLTTAASTATSTNNTTTTITTVPLSGIGATPAAGIPSAVATAPSAGSNPANAVATIPFFHSTAMRLIERMYFIHSPDWIFDSEEKTNWDLIGFPVPNYLERDRDLYQDELLASVLPVRPPGTSLMPAVLSRTSSSSVAGPNTPATSFSAMFTKSLQRMLFRNKSGDEDRDSSGTGTPDLVAPEGRSARSDSNASLRHLLPSLDSSLAGPDRSAGSIQSFLTAAASGSSSSSTNNNGQGAKRKEFPRIDRQYVHMLGIATVRIAANGFLWFSSSTTKISDMNMSMEEKGSISMKAMHQLELYCAVVPDIYDLLLETIDKAMLIAECHEICYEIADQVEEKRKTMSRTNSFAHSSSPSSPLHSYYPSQQKSQGPPGTGGSGWTTPRSPPAELTGTSSPPLAQYGSGSANNLSGTINNSSSSLVNSGVSPKTRSGSIRGLFGSFVGGSGSGGGGVSPTTLSPSSSSHGKAGNLSLDMDVVQQQTQQQEKLSSTTSPNQKIFRDSGRRFPESSPTSAMMSKGVDNDYTPRTNSSSSVSHSLSRGRRRTASSSSSSSDDEVGGKGRHYQEVQVLYSRDSADDKAERGLKTNLTGATNTPSKPSSTAEEGRLSPYQTSKTSAFQPHPLP